VLTGGVAEISFVIACCYVAEFLHFRETVFNQMPSLVGLGVVVTQLLCFDSGGIITIAARASRYSVKAVKRFQWLIWQRED
jgi:uncharacterized membrane protein